MINKKLGLAVLATAAIVATAGSAASASAAEFAFSFAIGQVAGQPGDEYMKSPTLPPYVLYSKPLSRRFMPAQNAHEDAYVRVPVYQANNWERYCARYEACGLPVRFVADGWFQTVYVTRYNKDRYSTIE